MLVFSVTPFLMNFLKNIWKWNYTRNSLSGDLCFSLASVQWGYAGRRWLKVLEILAPHMRSVDFILVLNGNASLDLPVLLAYSLLPNFSTTLPYPRLILHKMLAPPLLMCVSMDNIVTYWYPIYALLSDSFPPPISALSTMYFSLWWLGSGLPVCLYNSED